MDLPLFSYQRHAIDRFLKKPSLLVAHPTGSGKTVIALGVIEGLPKLARVLVVAPANTLPQWISVAKRKAGLSFTQISNEVNFEERLQICSYDMLRKISAEKAPSFDLLVYDEIHHCKNSETENFRVAWILRKKAKFFLGLTATPFQNGFREFASIVNLAAGDSQYIDPNVFLKFRWDYSNSWFFQKLYNAVILQRSLRGPVIGIKKTPTLHKRLAEIVDCVPEEFVSQESMRPIASIKTIYVPLTDNEWRTYSIAIKNVKRKYLKRLKDETYSDEDLGGIYKGLTPARQALIVPDHVLKATTGEVSTKVRAIAESIKGREGRFLVFCNFVKLGVEAIAKELIRAGIKAQPFSGKLSKKKRHELIERFYSGEVNCLCMSPVGGEGLDLANITEIHFADMHFNPEVVSQVIGRGLRANTKREIINVYQYVSKGPNGECTVDEYVQKIAERKSKVIQDIQGILRGEINEQDN